MNIKECKKKKKLDGFVVHNNMSVHTFLNFFLYFSFNFSIHFEEELVLFLSQKLNQIFKNYCQY